MLRQLPGALLATTQANAVPGASDKYSLSTARLHCQGPLRRFNSPHFADDPKEHVIYR